MDPKPSSAFIVINNIIIIIIINIIIIIVFKNKIIILPFRWTPSLPLPSSEEDPSVEALKCPPPGTHFIGGQTFLMLMCIFDMICVNIENDINASIWQCNQLCSSKQPTLQRPSRDKRSCRSTSHPLTPQVNFLSPEFFLLKRDENP